MQSKIQKALIVAVLVLGLSANPHLISAGSNVWTYAGLTGEYVNSVAISPLSPTTVYAGTRNGVFKTSNGGSNWVMQNLGDWYGYFIYAVAIDPNVPSNIYIGANGGVFKSANDGTNWSRINNTYAYSLAIDPITSTTIYAGTSSSGVLKSIDGGANWSPAATGLPNSPVRALAINPQATSILYAGTDTGIYKSINGGSNWSLANTGIPPSLTYIYDLVVDPITTTIVYAGLYEFGVYKSTNEGASWSPSNNGFPDPQSYAHEIVIDPINPSILYAGLSNGVFKSTNGGGNWSSISTGLTTQDVRSLAMDSTRTTLYAGSGGGGVFIWQTVPTLTINYTNGSPGSFFTLTGANFPSNSVATVIINGRTLTNTIPVDSLGGLTFQLSTAQADAGRYFVTAAVNPSATTDFTLDTTDPIRPQEGSGPIISVPNGIAFTEFLYLPLIQR
jgi:photosystem II stability/assembly factor-like uncharacterized protein